MDEFKLQIPQIEGKTPVIRLKPAYYQMVAALKAQTGIPIGGIVEQCIDFALDHMKEVPNDAS